MKLHKDINIYIMGGGVFFANFAVLILLLFVEIPDKNRDIVNTLTVSVSSMAMLVIGYFFGSSEKDKKNTTPPPNTEQIK